MTDSHDCQQLQIYEPFNPELQKNKLNFNVACLFISLFIVYLIIV